MHPERHYDSSLFASTNVALSFPKHLLAAVVALLLWSCATAVIAVPAACATSPQKNGGSAEVEGEQAKENRELAMELDLKDQEAEQRFAAGFAVPSAPAPNVFYFIVARHSGKGLDVKDRSQLNGATVQQWSFPGDPDRNMNKQFLFVPADGGYYFIVARHSGKGLDVEDRSMRNGARIQQWNLESGAENKQFRLIATTTPYQYIAARHSNKVLDVSNRSTSNGAILQQYDLNSGATNKQFRLVPANVARIPHVTVVPPREIDDPPSLGGYSMPPATTTPQLLGEVLVPFMLVADGSAVTQIDRNPYYKLSRYGYWKRVAYREHDGLTVLEERESTRTGLTIGNARTIQRTTSITMGADFGIKFGPLSTAFKGSITRQLNTTVSSSEELLIEKESEVTYTLPAGMRTARAVWHRADRYILTRVDGSLVHEWETTDERVARNKGWPEVDTVAAVVMSGNDRKPGSVCPPVWTADATWVTPATATGTADAIVSARTLLANGSTMAPPGALYGFGESSKWACLPRWNG